MSYPYRGGEKWTEGLAKKEHIVSITDCFGESVYVGEKIEFHQRIWLLNQKHDWESESFRGTVVYESKDSKQFCSRTLGVQAVSEFLHEIIPVQENFHVKRKGPLVK